MISITGNIIVYILLFLNPLLGFFLQKVHVSLKTVGIICEYNPFHNGHMSQYQHIRSIYGDDARIVCLMSGNYVQRGYPAIYDKSVRAKAAILCGADLVLELPINVCLSSAERFASGGIRILDMICDTICFGTETLTKKELLRTASVLNSAEYQDILFQCLSTGCSYPAARQMALEKLSLPTSALPNDILGIEYCRAVLNQQSAMEIVPIHRYGEYHSTELDSQAPSATAIRNKIISGHHWEEAVPQQLISLYRNASFHSLEYGEKAILYRLRCMREDEFEILPYGSEGLWRRFMHACCRETDLDAIISATKTKRYTRTRIDRMIMCAYLGLTEDNMNQTSPYVKVLAFNDHGRAILRDAKSKVSFIHAGQKYTHPFAEIESRAESLYGLFTPSPEPPVASENNHIFYLREQTDA